MRDSGPFARKAKARIGTPPSTDLIALSSEIRRLGPEAALPNKMPQKWLLHIARDLITSRVLEQSSIPRGEDPADRLRSSIVMIMTILGAQRCPDDSSPKPSEMSFSEEQICEYVDVYHYLILEEVAARAAGVKAADYNLDSIF